MEHKQFLFITLSFLFLTISVSGCSGMGHSMRGISRGSSDDSAGFTVTWLKGAENGSSFPTMGTVGVTDPSFYPFKMSYVAHTTDPSGNLWLYGGGNGTYNASPTYDNLWKYDGTNWTLLSGSATLLTGADASYGTVGVPGGHPGQRSQSNLVSTSNGNIWLFGGMGRTGGVTRTLNDLWKYDGTNWTWLKGATTDGWTGSYGTLGTTVPTNAIPSRAGAASWVDASNNIWIFGGETSAPGGGAFSDLWKYDGTNWTWMRGTSALNSLMGVPGTKGVAAAANYPSARSHMGQWKTSDGTVYVFGGNYSGAPGGGIYLYSKDLWKFDGTNWTWVHGPNSNSYGTAGTNTLGTYGVKGVAASTNIPGARVSPTTWVDSSDNLWMFGGLGYDSLQDANARELQDLWKFDGTNWTWMAGTTSSGIATRAGVYGTLGQGSPNYIPSSRHGAIPWKNGNDVHIFGGSGGWSVDGWHQDMLDDQWKFSW